jgi:twitching motility protein PilT
MVAEANSMSVTIESKPAAVEGKSTPSTVDARVAANREKVINYLAKLAQLEEGISDILLSTGCVPIVRVNGVLKRVGEKRLSVADVEGIVDAVLPSDKIRDEVLRRRAVRDFDCSYGILNIARFRINVFYQRNNPAVVMRQISAEVPTIESLNLPPILKKIAEAERGLVLVTGITGSGKSSTLAGMLDHINTTLNKHIITIEDPVEFLHRDKLSVIRQREIGTDTDNFAIALRAAMRQNPDVILVGEMRDAETIEIALQAAETGHMVFSTLHTSSATGSVNRIIDAFPPHQQYQVRLQLAENLYAIISERLLPRKGTNNRIPAVEVLLGTLRAKEYIRNSDKTNRLLEVIEEGRAQYGMQSFDQHIQELYVRGQLDLETSCKAATSATDLLVRLQTEGFKIDPEILAKIK